MSLQDRLMEDMKKAMKAGSKNELDTIRMVRAQIKDRRIEKGSDLSESDVEQVLQKAAKTRKEAIEMYRQGEREDLVAKETAEYEIISRYLPEQMSEQEIEKIVKEAIGSLNISDDKDIGRLMGAVMPAVKGKADGKLVQQIARNALLNLTQ